MNAFILQVPFKIVPSGFKSTQDVFFVTVWQMFVVLVLLDWLQVTLRTVPLRIRLGRRLLYNCFQCFRTSISFLDIPTEKAHGHNYYSKSREPAWKHWQKEDIEQKSTDHDSRKIQGARKVSLRRFIRLSLRKRVASAIIWWTSASRILPAPLPVTSLIRSRIGVKSTKGKQFQWLKVWKAKPCWNIDHSKIEH